MRFQTLVPCPFANPCYAMNKIGYLRPEEANRLIAAAGQRGR
jgi:hypothetical protein